MLTYICRRTVNVTFHIAASSCYKKYVMENQKYLEKFVEYGLINLIL